MTLVQPALDGSIPAPKVPAARRKVEDFEAWVTEVWPAFEAAADSGQPFTIDEIASKHRLPDPPNPQSQWGSLPNRLQNAGVIRHHGYGGSKRAHDSLVHIWIGVPTQHREAVARRRREDRAARIEQRRAA